MSSPRWMCRASTEPMSTALQSWPPRPMARPRRRPRRLRLSAEELATGVVPRLPVGARDRHGHRHRRDVAARRRRGRHGRAHHAQHQHQHRRHRGPRAPARRPRGRRHLCRHRHRRGELVLRKGTRLSGARPGCWPRSARGPSPSCGGPGWPSSRPATRSSRREHRSRRRQVYDANATLLADAVRELGGEPVALGIVGDDPGAWSRCWTGAWRATSCSSAVGRARGRATSRTACWPGDSPGILVHGVALKPGKPICLGAVGATPVAILPGFPTSAIFTFHEFIAPVLRQLGGGKTEARGDPAGPDARALQ